MERFVLVDDEDRVFCGIPSEGLFGLVKHNGIYYDTSPRLL